MRQVERLVQTYDIANGLMRDFRIFPHENEEAAIPDYRRVRTTLAAQVEEGPALPHQRDHRDRREERRKRAPIQGPPVLRPLKRGSKKIYAFFSASAAATVKTTRNPRSETRLERAVSERTESAGDSRIG